MKKLGHRWMCLVLFVIVANLLPSSLALQELLMPTPVDYQSTELQSLLSFDYVTAGNAPATTKWAILHSQGLLNTSTQLQMADGITPGKTVLRTTNVSEHIPH